MWYPILFILCLSTGQTTFSITRLHYETKEECEFILSQVEANYQKDYVIKAGCAEFPIEQGI